MTTFTSALNNTMRAIASGLQYPVIIVLLILLACTVVLLGFIICEYFTEHRHLKAKLPKLVDDLNTTDNLPLTISKSGLLKRQKAALIEITKHPDIPNESRNALAIRLIEQEEDHYSRKVKSGDLIAKLGPIFGLLGTLIPLGPGIIALGQGDTYTLSVSLLTAFDTTIVGLVCAAVAMVITTIRKRWYAKYISILKALMECVLEAVEK